MFNRRTGKLKETGQLITVIYLVPNAIQQGDIVKVFWNKLDDGTGGWWYFANSPIELEQSVDCEILDAAPLEKIKKLFSNIFKKRLLI